MISLHTPEMGCVYQTIKFARQLLMKANGVTSTFEFGLKC